MATQLLRNDGFASSGGKRLCPLPAVGCSHQSAIDAPFEAWSKQYAANVDESPFGCLESVNLILGLNLVLVAESFVKGQQSELCLG